jgi:hypothetical protein
MGGVHDVCGGLKLQDLYYLYLVVGIELARLVIRPLLVQYTSPLVAH